MTAVENPKHGHKAGSDMEETQYDLSPYRSIYLLTTTAKRMPEVEHMQARADDIIVTAFPKSGTTWTQAMVQLILFDSVSPITEIGMDMSDEWCHLEFLPPTVVAQKSSPRLLKTHLPRNLFPTDLIQKQCQTIYVYRNPKDVMVSLYHFCKNVPMIQNTCPHDTFEAFVDAFIAGKVIWGPYFPNIASFWTQRHDPRILILSYDDIHRNREDNVLKIANFLGKTMTTEQVQRVVQASSFKEMAKLDATQASKEKAGSFTFLRCGKSEQWHSHFTDKLQRKVDDWIAMNLAAAELEGFHF